MLSSISPLYAFIEKSAKGHLGGLIIGWKKSSIRCTNTWGSTLGLGTQICWAEANLTLTILNIYGMYSNRVDFWDSFKNSRMSKEENLIIGGDLNFTLGANESWGPKERMNPLAPYFSNLLMELELIDLDTQNLKPT